MSTLTYREGDREIPITEHTIDQLARGELSLMRFGNPVRYELTKAQRVHLVNARHRGYAVTRTRDRALRNLYWKFCEVTKRPFIVVDPRVKYSAVECDPICSDWAPSATALADIARLQERYRQYGGWFSPGPHYIHLSRVPISKGEDVAALLWLIYTEDIRPPLEVLE